MVEPADSHDELRNKIDEHTEWLLVHANGRSFPLRSEEIELTQLSDRIQFCFPDDAGYHSWRLNAFKMDEGEIVVDVAGRFGKNRETMRLVPRTPAAELAEETEIARLKKANEIGRAIADARAAKIIRIALSKENSRIAHIFYKTGVSTLHAAMADVTGTAPHESLVCSALVWLQRLEARKKDPIDIISIAADKKRARSLQKLLAMLSDRERKRIEIIEIAGIPDDVEVKMLPARRLSELWRERPRKLVFPDNPFPSKAAQRIIALKPEKIDVLYSKQGETLRFLGLPFARVRTMLGRDKAWFGVGREKRVLNYATTDDLVRLVEELDENRDAESANKRHEYYRLAPEAWLEAILRRNIRLLDANLILSPIYSQFRTMNDKIDLLALRRDGRLVVIELKTTPDRAAIFQAADYWRKIELQRRSGQLDAAKAFGDRKILDKPALIYLAAPALSFHRDHELFSSMLASEIELWRFELHENWRAAVKVIARTDHGDPLSGRTNR